MPRKKTPPILLTQEQKEIVNKLFHENPDLTFLTRRAFKNRNLDGRSKEGRAVRSYIAEMGEKHITKVPTLQVVLTNQQREFLMSDSIGPGMLPIEVARIVFKDKNIKVNSKHHLAVNDFLNEFRQDITDESNALASGKWFPPQGLTRAIYKVNKSIHKDFSEDTMPTKYKKYCVRLIDYLHSPRFISVINQYNLQSDRDLFEAEYVRATWDKPDLTVDEINNYITVCSNYVRLKHIQRRIDNLNKLLNLEHDDAALSIKLNELIKTTSAELNDCEKRIETMTRSLNGSRADRLKNKVDENGSILSLVEAFQSEEERKKLLALVEMENVILEQEVNRLEGMEEFKARIMGIEKEELI